MQYPQINISAAELEIMKVLWEREEPTTAQELSDKLVHKDWKYSTIATPCGRMVEKGTITYQRHGRFFYYTPTITAQEYKAAKTKDLVGSLYGGAVKNLVAALFENGGLSEADIEELKMQFKI